MRKINHTLTTIIVFLLFACGGSEHLEAKKTELEKLRAESIELNSKISALEAEIVALDPSSAPEKGTQTLVSSTKLTKGLFIHKIESRGSVASRNNVTISSETMGRVEKVLAPEGRYVKKGELLIQLDTDIISNQISEIQTNFDLARAVFDRQAKLWEQNIGTEIQYLQAQANKEALERRLVTLNAQLAQAYVRAPFSGSVDAVYTKVGEVVQPGVPVAQIVGDENMYITADVSEAFLGKFKKGDTVNIKFPSQNKEFTSKIVALGKVINNQNRTFNMEVHLPRILDFEYSPNQVTILSLVDYQIDSAITVPTNVILTDDESQFVYTLINENDESLAKKVRVTVGKSYNDKTEILSGLEEGEEIISSGYRDVTDGALVKLVTARL